jgi:hypothetical protein
MRGSQTLLLFCIDKPSEAADSSARRKKGRSEILNKKRNECLAARFFFYLNFTDRRYDKIIADLSKEFFLSAATIPDVLTDNAVLLNELRINKPDKKYFVSNWPHLNWKID